MRDSQDRPLIEQLSDGRVVLAVRVIPRARKSGIEGVRAGALAVRLAAPPVEGAANAALVELIAKSLGIPRRAVSLLSGERSRDKRLAISGISAADVRRRLAPAPSD